MNSSKHLLYCFVDVIFIAMICTFFGEAEELIDYAWMIAGVTVIFGVLESFKENCKAIGFTPKEVMSFIGGLAFIPIFWGMEHILGYFLVVVMILGSIGFVVDFYKGLK